MNGGYASDLSEYNAPEDKVNITQEDIKSVLWYDQSTGLFKRISTSKVAGTLRKDGYVYIGVKGKQYLAHRLAFIYMEGEAPTFVDHLNGIRSDNRWSNLRKTSHAENMRNQKKRSTNTSGVSGVDWLKGTSKWRARIKVKGKEVYLGLFENVDDAKEEVRKAKDKFNFSIRHGK